MNEIKETSKTKQCDRIWAARILLKIMKFVGLWQLKSYKADTGVGDSQGYYPILETMQKILVHIPFTFIYIFLMWLEVWTSSNLEKASDVLYMSFTEAALIVKILNIWRHADKAWNFINELANSKRYEFLHSEEVEIWRKKQKQFRYVVFIYMSGSLLTLIGAGVGVLFAKEYELPFAYWVPFDWRASTRNYWIAYVYSLIGISVTAASNVCVDMMGCYMLFHISLLYKVLGLRLARLNVIQKDDFVKEFRSIFEFNKNLKRMTKDCERIVSTYVFSQIILSALILCFSGYRIQKVLN